MGNSAVAIDVTDRRLIRSIRTVWSDDTRNKNKKGFCYGVKDGRVTCQLLLLCLVSGRSWSFQDTKNELVLKSVDLEMKRFDDLFPQLWSSE